MALRRGHDSRRLDDPKDLLRRELEAALERGILLIPILLEGTKIPDPDELPESLAGLSTKEALALSDQHFQAGIGRLSTRLDDLARRKRQDAPNATPRSVTPEGVAGKTKTARGVPDPRQPHRKRAIGYLLAGIGVVVAAVIAVNVSAADGAGNAQSLNTTAGDLPDGVLTTISVGRGPSGVATGAAAVWVTNSDDDTVSRIDATTHAAKPIKVGDKPYGVAVGAQAVWVTNSGDNTVSRIDPLTNTETAKIPVGAEPLGVAVSDDLVWVTNHKGGSVSRIDPTTNTATAIHVGPKPWGIAAGPDAVWVIGDDVFDSRVRHLDPIANRVTRIPVGAIGCSIAVGSGAVWVPVAGHRRVRRINVATRKAATVAVDGEPTGVALGGGAIWIADANSGSVSRVDADSRDSRASGGVGASCGLAVDGDAIWVTNRDEDIVSRVKL